jgi:hypothetical protein
MPTQDTFKIKESMIEFLKKNGPNLPVQISKHLGMDSIFGSAFLSELLSQKKIKITNMKVGGSPIYYIEGTEEKLEKFAQEYLKLKEKEAFILLKEKKFLIDSNQEPAIRIALRSIKDFAKPFEKEGKIIWRYFLEKEENFSSKTENNYIPKQITSKTEEQLNKSEKKEENKEVNKKISEEKPIKKKTTKKRTYSKRKVQDKKNEKFFNTIKEQLTKNNQKITDIIGFSKGHLTLKIKEGNEEKILVAYNKKRLTEIDIINAYKKAKEYNLKYIIFSFGEPAKKTINFIKAIKNLSSIEKIE